MSEAIASTPLGAKEVWTIQRLLNWTTEFFNSKNISSSRLDAEILLTFVLNCKRLDLYLKFDQPLKDQELKIFKELVLRRSKREPVAYIVGRQEFYGRPFIVGPGVLIPRPETEHLVDEVLKWVKQLNPPVALPANPIKIFDIGTGSGCIGLTLALEIPDARVIACDIHESAIKISRANAQALQASGRFVVEQKDFSSFNWLEKLAQDESDFNPLELKDFDIIVSNPPYIALDQKEKLQQDVVMYEPPEALFGGEKGHELLAKWLPKMTEALKPGGLLVCELGFDQGKIAKELAEKEKILVGIQIIRDYSGHVRLLKAQKEK